jgi:aspartyl-tRNA(Asn)/glutamyl-tRNA(Gln) amidotransferase subunit B
VFEEMYNTGRSPGEIAEQAGMSQISDADEVRAAVDKAVSENPQPVADYLGGKENAMRFLVGQVMKATRGKANPQVAFELVREKLESMR